MKPTHTTWATNNGKTKRWNRLKPHTCILCHSDYARNYTQETTMHLQPTCMHTVTLTFCLLTAAFWGLVIHLGLQSGYVFVPAQGVDMPLGRGPAEKRKCFCVRLRRPVAGQVTAAAQVLIQSLNPASILTYAQ